LFDVVSFVQAPTEVRIRRLRDREARHFGADAVSPGGWRHQETEEFIEWACHYDDDTREVAILVAIKHGWTRCLAPRSASTARGQQKNW
jgi:hypothetical protein